MSKSSNKSRAAKEASHRVSSEGKPHPGRVTLTPRLAHISGEDAANRQMRAAGRTEWNADDHRLACITNARLCIHLGGMHEVAARDVLNRMGIAS